MPHSSSLVIAVSETLSIIRLQVFIKLVITLRFAKKNKNQKILLFNPSTTTLRRHPSKTNILNRHSIGAELPDIRLVYSILAPSSALQTLRPVLRKSEPRILHHMASRVLSLCRLASPEVRVRAEQHREFCAVESAHPGFGGEVCPVAGVFVAVSGEAGLLA